MDTMTFNFFIIFQIVELINVTAKKMSREGNVIVVREDFSVFFQITQTVAYLVGKNLSKKYSPFWAYIISDIYIHIYIYVT